MFNKYQWNDYVQSGGRKIIKIFEDMLNFKNMEEYILTVRSPIKV